MRRRLVALLLLAALALPSVAAPLVRVKDIAHLIGVRDNQLVGYGIVVGLQGTGDSSRSAFTIMSVLSMLEKLGVPLVSKLSQFGISVDQNSLNIKNLAAVIITVNLPPFASSGQKLDVTVSAIGDAQSLEGGILLQSPLLGADGKVYAVAQGPVSLGGGAPQQGAGAARGGGGSSVRTTGRVASGAIVEREIVSELISPDGTLTWILKRPDFATASRLADAINAAYRPAIARAESAERIRVLLPANFRDNPVPFIARIEDLMLQPDETAKVVVNERTGTIVFGENVKVSTVAVSHGSLSVSIKGEVAANAPAGGGGLQAATIAASEETENTMTIPDGTSVRDVVKALNAIGATPRDIIAILQGLSQAGALHGALEFI